MNDIDWNLLRTFLRVAEEGSFTGAAEVLGISQPTVSRQMQQLEETLSVPLFIRHARGFELTDRGQDLLAAAREVEQGVAGFLRRAGGLTREVRGAVRISASGPVAVHILPPCLASLRQDYPELTFELVVDNKASNLLRREADIAVRLFRPEQLDIVCTRAGEAEVGLCASRDYLDRRGRPTSVAELAGHDIIGEDRGTQVDAALAKMGLSPEPTDYSLRTDSYLAHLSAIRAGLGIGGAQIDLFADDPHVERVLPELTLGAMPFWVAMHGEVRNSAAIRVVYDALVDYLRARNA
jgi:DNA-binding transcriptional LysR family regulator